MFRRITLPALIAACVVSAWTAAVDLRALDEPFTPWIAAAWIAAYSLLAAAVFAAAWITIALTGGAYMVMRIIGCHFIDGFRELTSAAGAEALDGRPVEGAQLAQRQPLHFAGLPVYRAAQIATTRTWRRRTGRGSNAGAQRRPLLAGGLAEDLIEAVQRRLIGRVKRAAEIMGGENNRVAKLTVPAVAALFGGEAPARVAAGRFGFARFGGHLKHHIKIRFRYPISI